MFASAFALAVTGCATGPDYKVGQRAERNGEPHVAYDAYVRSAGQNPNNGMVKSALKRVTPKAAEHWEKEGHKAVSQRRYSDAWRSFMRVLEIRPDHPSAALVVRQLEQEHPSEVAYARQDYEQRGARSLVVTGDSGKSSGPVQVAQGSTNRGAYGDLGSEDDLYIPGPTVRNSPPPPAPAPTAPYGAQSGVGAVPNSTHSPEPMTSSAAPLPYNPPESTYSQPQPYPPTAPMAPTNTARPAPITSVGPGPFVSESRISADVGPPTGFMVVRTLSKEDRRYARRREFVDGVAIRLDSVDDHDADLELYMGGVQVAEIKDIRVNESSRFVGQTGRQFRLVVLDIRESTETVRVGVSPL